MERVMGIEYIALAKLFFSNHEVTSTDERCVRFLCEKTPPHQPISAIAPILLLRISLTFATRFYASNGAIIYASTGGSDAHHGYT
jgi:hypothetical protein